MESEITYWQLVDPIWDTVSIYDGGDTFLAQLSKVTEKQKVLFTVHWAQSEIRNGGLHQFFSNSTGVLAPEAVQSFLVLGMPNCSSAIDEAMKFFSASFPREREIREKQLSLYEDEHGENWNPFIELDNQFFDAIEEEHGGFEQAANEYANKG